MCHRIFNKSLIFWLSGSTVDVNSMFPEDCVFHDAEKLVHRCACMCLNLQMNILTYGKARNPLAYFYCKYLKRLVSSCTIMFDTLDLLEKLIKKVG